MLPPRFESVYPNDGFDPFAAPPWLMVPLRGSKRLRLIHGSGLKVVSTSPHIAEVQEAGGMSGHKGGLTSRTWSDVMRGTPEGMEMVRRRTRETISPMTGPAVRQFVVRGKMVGRSYLEARISDTVVRRIEVSVKPRKIVKIAFNFVQDSAGHGTRRNVQDVPDFVKVMNEIMTPQANIAFQLNNAREVRVNRNLGDVVRFSRHLEGVARSEHEWDIVTAQADRTADFNVFFVWEYEQDRDTTQDGTDAGALAGNCIFEDRAGQEVGETLAHEAGHYLGSPDVYDSWKIDRLMYGFTDVRGRRIPRTDALNFNPQ